MNHFAVIFILSASAHPLCWALYDEQHRHIRNPFFQSIANWQCRRPWYCQSKPYIIFPRRLGQNVGLPPLQAQVFTESYFGMAVRQSEVPRSELQLLLV